MEIAMFSSPNSHRWVVVKLIAAVLLLTLGVISTRVTAAPTWTNTVTGFWTNNLGWNPTTVPAGGDSPVVSSSGTVQLNAASASLNAITVASGGGSFIDV